MAIARAAAAMAVLGIASLAWCQDEDLGKTLERAHTEVAYMSFEKALPLYRAVAGKAPEGSEAWQAAIFGEATCQQQIMPASKETMDDASRRFELLVEKAPNSKFAPRAMMNVGRIAELVDYLGDVSDRETARKWYQRALEASRGKPLEGEAALRIAATYIQTMQKDQLMRGLDMLRAYLADHDKDLLASAMWQYMGETYFYPLEDYRNAMDCYKRADALGLLEEGREGPVYWRMAILADRYLHDRDTAIEYYTKIIKKTPTSGKAYEAQLALKKLGIEPPKIEIFDITADESDVAGATVPATKEVIR